MKSIAIMILLFFLFTFVSISPLPTVLATIENKPSNKEGEHTQLMWGGTHSSEIYIQPLGLTEENIEDERGSLDKEAFYLTDFKKEVPEDKIWTITFSNEIEPTTITNESLFVLDSSGNKLPNFIVNDGKKTVTIFPPMDGYIPQENYTINITSTVTSIHGKALNEHYQIPFFITDENEEDITPLHHLLLDKDENNNPYLLFEKAKEIFQRVNFKSVGSFLQPD